MSLRNQIPELDAGPTRGLFVRQWLACRALSPLHHALGARRQADFGIITYHSISDLAGDDRRLLNVTPDRFERQMSELLALGFQAWPLRRVLQFHRARRPIPRNVFVVVFDDGHRNVHDHAFPILRRLSVPATIFLATSFLDSPDPFPFDPDPDSSRLPLTSEQCRRMQDSGVIDLGSHTHAHRDFRGRDEEFRRDLSASFDVLRRRFGVAEVPFSFPYGLSTSGMIEHVRRAGFTCSLSTESRLVTPADTPWRWGRFGATELDTGATLAGKLDGWYDVLRDCWRGLRGRR